MTSNGNPHGDKLPEHKPSARAWSDLPAQLGDAVGKMGKLLSEDTQFKAFADTRAITNVIVFGIKAAGTDKTILVTIHDGGASATSADNYDKASFTLCALPEQWEQFFKQTPVAPYQSYWYVRRAQTEVFHG